MTSIEGEHGALHARPKSLSASSLLKRAGAGLLILCIGIAASAWIYDASIQPDNTNDSRLTKIAAPNLPAHN